MTEQKVHLLKSAFGSCFRQGKDEYYFTCPICKHENKKKLAINIIKNSFHCWVCDFRGKNVRRLLKARLSYSKLCEWDRINNVVDLSKIDNNIFESIKHGKELVELPEQFISLANSNLPTTTKFAHKYLLDRGLTKQDIVLWKIGACLSGPYEGRVIIPSFDLNGDCDYFIARGYGKQFPKYMNPKVSKDIIFNELFIDWNKEIILVEGVFDAIKAENAIPLLGSTLSEDTNLFKKIAHYDPVVYVALDPDAETKSNEIINRLLKYDIEVYKVNIKGFEDVGAMTKNDFLQFKQNAKLITDDWFLENQIMAI